MSLWSYNKPPTYKPNAAGNPSGWIDPETGEVLVAIRQLTEKATNPIIAGVLVPVPQTYVEGQVLTFELTFGEPVVVVGVPQIELDIGGVQRFATFNAGLSAGPKTVFNYTVQAAETDNNGISAVSPIDLNGGTIQDASANNVDLNWTVPDLTGVLVAP